MDVRINGMSVTAWAKQQGFNSVRVEDVGGGKVCVVCDGLIFDGVRVNEVTQRVSDHLPNQRGYAHFGCSDPTQVNCTSMGLLSVVRIS